MIRFRTLGALLKATCFFILQHGTSVVVFLPKGEDNSPVSIMGRRGASFSGFLMNSAPSYSVRSVLTYLLTYFIENNVFFSLGEGRGIRRRSLCFLKSPTPALCIDVRVGGLILFSQMADILTLTILGW